MYEIIDGIIKVLGHTLTIEKMLQKEIHTLRVSLALTIFSCMLFVFYVMFLHYSNLKRIKKLEKGKK